MHFSLVGSKEIGDIEEKEKWPLTRTLITRK